LTLLVVGDDEKLGGTVCANVKGDNLGGSVGLKAREKLSQFEPCLQRRKELELTPVTLKGCKIPISITSTILSFPLTISLSRLLVSAGSSQVYLADDRGWIREIVRDLRTGSVMFSVGFESCERGKKGFGVNSSCTQREASNTRFVDDSPSDRT
jgi:hypothetical protein